MALKSGEVGWTRWNKVAGCRDWVLCGGWWEEGRVCVCVGLRCRFISSSLGTERVLCQPTTGTHPPTPMLPLVQWANCLVEGDNDWTTHTHTHTHTHTQILEYANMTHPLEATKSFCKTYRLLHQFSKQSAVNCSLHTWYQWRQQAHQFHLWIQSNWFVVTPKIRIFTKTLTDADILWN